MADIFSHSGKLRQNNQEAVDEGYKHYRFAKNVMLDDGKEQETLVDTGAMVSSVSWDTANKLKLYTFKTPIKSIQYGSGATQSTRDKAIMKFSVNGVPTHAFLYVVNKQNTEIILGMDWMVHEDWLLRPATKELFKMADVQNTQEITKTREEQLAEDILKYFPSVILDDNSIQTVTNTPYKNRIVTGDALPVHVPDYRRPFAETKQIKLEVAEMLRKKVTVAVGFLTLF